MAMQIINITETNLFSVQLLFLLGKNGLSIPIGNPQLI